jgi:hypothetical protein
MDLGTYQNDIAMLPALNNYRYENIFKIYQNNDKQYYYNITKKIVIPIKNLDPTQFIYFPIKQKMPWTMASFQVYSTIELWWLLCLVNNITNPIIQPKAGTYIKALLPSLVAPLINNIKTQLL